MRRWLFQALAPYILSVPHVFHGMQLDFVLSVSHTWREPTLRMGGGSGFTVATQGVSGSHAHMYRGNVAKKPARSHAHVYGGSAADAVSN